MNRIYLCPSSGGQSEAKKGEERSDHSRVGEKRGEYLNTSLGLHQGPDLLLSVGGREISNEDTAPLSGEAILLNVTNLAALPTYLGASHPRLL